jgi:hypothetical protein
MMSEEEFRRKDGERRIFLHKDTLLFIVMFSLVLSLILLSLPPPFLITLLLHRREQPHLSSPQGLLLLLL